MYTKSLILCDNYKLSIHDGILLCVRMRARVCVWLAEWAMLINKQTGSCYKHMSYN
jgi:hypothetical protein